MPNEKFQLVVFYPILNRFHPSFDTWTLAFGIIPPSAMVPMQQRPVQNYTCDYPGNLIP
jgi:hypothetical protein